MKNITKKQAEELQKLQWMKNDFIKESRRMLKIMEKQEEKVNKMLVENE